VVSAPLRRGLSDSPEPSPLQKSARTKTSGSASALVAALHNARQRGMAGLTGNQSRDPGMGEHHLGFAAEQYAAEPATAVRCHENEIALFLRRHGEDDSGRKIVRYVYALAVNHCMSSIGSLFFYFRKGSSSRMLAHLFSAGQYSKLKTVRPLCHHHQDLFSPPKAPWAAPAWS